MTTEITESAVPETPFRTKKMMKKWGKRGIYLAIAGGIIWYFFGRPEAPIEYVTEKVQVGMVRQIVEVSGTVESDAKRELLFQTSGKISSLLVKVGDEVDEGQTLATLDSRSLSIEVEKTEAAMRMAQAELDLQYAGPIWQDIRISQTQIEEAQLVLTHSAKKLQDTKRANNEKETKAQQEIMNTEVALENAEIAYETAKGSGDITGKISGKSLDDIIIEARKTILSALDSIDHSLSVANDIIGKNTYGSESAKYTYIGFLSPQEKILATNQYRLLRSKYKSLLEKYDGTEDTQDKSLVNNFLSNLEPEVKSSKDLMDTVFLLLNNSVTGTNLTESQIDIYKTEVKTEQTSLLNNLDAVRDMRRDIQDTTLNVEGTDITTSSSIESAKTNLDARNSTLELSKKNLSNIKIQNQNALNAIKREIDVQKLLLQKSRENHEKLIAKPRSVDVAAYQARVQQQMATWKQAVKNLEDVQIVSPTYGIITEINYEIGENINMNDTIITLQTKGLQMKANIPETDITKLSIDNSTEFTLDAFPADEIFTGKILEINPAETVIQGVIYYESTMSFDVKDERIKSGMTSDIEILSAKKTNVINISPEALRFEDNQPFVFVIENGVQKRKNINIGIEGEDAVEVEEGLSEGERVVLYEKENKD